MHTAMDKTECSDAHGKVMSLEDAVEKGFRLMKTGALKGRKTILIGNGGSASIASHVAVDLWKNGGVKAIAFNDSSLLTCIGNDFGYEHVFRVPIEEFADEGDTLIAISSSGRSKNILLGVEAARKKGCAVITMSSFSSDNPLRLKGDVNFYVPSKLFSMAETVHALIAHALIDCVIAQKDS